MAPLKLLALHSSKTRLPWTTGVVHTQDCSSCNQKSGVMYRRCADCAHALCADCFNKQGMRHEGLCRSAHRWFPTLAQEQQILGEHGAKAPDRPANLPEPAGHREDWMNWGKVVFGSDNLERHSGFDPPWGVSVSATGTTFMPIRNQPRDWRKGRGKKRKSSPSQKPEPGTQAPTVFPGAKARKRKPLIRQNETSDDTGALDVEDHYSDDLYIPSTEEQTEPRTRPAKRVTLSNASPKSKMEEGTAAERATVNTQEEEVTARFANMKSNLSVNSIVRPDSPSRAPGANGGFQLPMPVPASTRRPWPARGAPGPFLGISIRDGDICITDPVYAETVRNSPLNLPDRGPYSRNPGAHSRTPDSQSNNQDSHSSEPPIVQTTNEQEKVSHEAGARNEPAVGQKTGEQVRVTRESNTHNEPKIFQDTSEPVSVSHKSNTRKEPLDEDSSEDAAPVTRKTSERNRQSVQEVNERAQLPSPSKTRRDHKQYSRSMVTGTSDLTRLGPSSHAREGNVVQDYHDLIAASGVVTMDVRGVDTLRIELARGMYMRTEATGNEAQMPGQMFYQYLDRTGETLHQEFLLYIDDAKNPKRELIGSRDLPTNGEIKGDKIADKTISNVLGAIESAHVRRSERIPKPAVVPESAAPPNPAKKTPTRIPSPVLPNRRGKLAEDVLPVPTQATGNPDAYDEDFGPNSDFARGSSPDPFPNRPEVYRAWRR